MQLHLGIGPWAVLIVGALLIGLSKTGISGIGIFAVALFALVLPTRESVGAVLPVLIAADLVAVTAYRRHAVWPYLWPLFPWAAAGIIVGYFAIGRINDRQVATLVGVILLVLVVLQWWRMRRAQAASATADTDVPTSLPFVATVGILAGFTTMVANAAGPIMILYLLAMRLPKMEFIGTGAWYFLLLNLFKVPFSLQLGLISPTSLAVDLWLFPLAIIGAIGGRALIPYINQQLFESLALIFTVIAAIKLLV